MKELLWFLLVGIIGAIVTTIVDFLLGIDLVTSVGLLNSTLHMVMYVIWGALLHKSLQRLGR